MADARDEATAAQMLERTVDHFADWVRFGDAKAAGVLALQALGIADLLHNANRLANAHESAGFWAWSTTLMFWAAVVLAVLVVTVISTALFPRVKPARESIFYFGTVAKYDGGAAFADHVRALTENERVEHLAGQSWELATIGARKYARTRLAYWFVLAFLAAWASSRLAMTLV
jgi:hypothetical protein